jgi:hypothetical protein
MPKSKAYVLCAGIFAVIAIAAISRATCSRGILMLLEAIGCAVRANSEGKREQG